MIANLNLCVSWKPVNPQECVWKNLYQNIMMTILQEKGPIHCNNTIWYTNFFQCLKAMKIPAAQAAMVKEWEKLEKIQAWNIIKVRNKLDVIDEAKTNSCCFTDGHLSFEECRMETKHPKYKGRVALRSDIVKDDSGSYAVFTEQGSSASQMTAAKIMDIISRLPGCDGQAADAISAYPQVKMEDAHKLFKIPKSECPDVWIRLPKRKWPKSWSNMEDPVVLLGRNLYGHPLARLFWEKQFEKFLLKYCWENVTNWECLFAHREKDYSNLCMWMT